MACCGNDDEAPPAENTRTTIPVRGCTDVLWLCMFIVFWFVMIFIAAFAYVYGNPLRLINGYDSFGNTCGTANNEKMGGFALSGLDTTDKQYLFYMDVKNIKKSLKLCVKQCPDRRLETLHDIQDFYKRTGSMVCTYNFSSTSKEWKDRVKSEDVHSSLGPCPPMPVYESVPVLNRCVPRPLKEVADHVLFNLYAVLNSWDTVEQVLSDLYATWREILGLTILSFVLSLVMIAVLHLLASLVAWIFMLIVSIAAIVGTGMLWWTYVDIKRQLDNTPSSQLLDESVSNESAFLIYSIVATVITIIILLLVVAVRKSISSMARLFEESAECLAALPALFLQPFITFLALMAFFSFWVSVIVCLATSSYPGAESFHPFLGSSLSSDAGPRQSMSSDLKTLIPQKNVSLAGIKSFTFPEFVEPMWVRYMWWLYLIGLVWTSEFILSCQQMVIAGAVAQWVFANRSKQSVSVLSSMGKLICYHLGSVAKGSFLITIFKLPRLVLTYIDRKLRKHRDAGSTCASCGMKACICCLYCLENFIKFINHNAYTVIAMQGYSFCTSAKIAFSTLVSNALDLATLNSVGDFILFLGKCFVTAATGSVGLIFMKQNPHLHFYAIPTLVVCIFSYFIAHSVLSLYEIVIDTMFLCMCEGKKLYGSEWGESSASKKETNGNNSSELEPMNNQR
ncbi:choline transporter-like 1 [Periplaneta americana]